MSAAVFSSRVVGLVREQVFAIGFGAGRELDAFITAFRIPNLLRDLFAEGALSSAFVTTFAQARARQGEAAAWRLANLVVNGLGIIVGTLCCLGIVFAPAITRAIAPGFESIPGKLELTITLTRILFPFLVMIALAAVAMGALNTHGIFGIPAAASTFFNLGSVLGGIACVAWLAPGYVTLAVAPHPPGAGPTETLTERAILGMAIGTMIGGLLQLLIQLPSLTRVGYRYRPVVSFRDPGLRQVLRLMGPATIGAAAVQVNVFVNSNFASYLGDGPVSWLNVAFRFMQLPIGLFGVAIGTVALPTLSRQVADGAHVAVVRTLRQSLEMVALLCIPAAVGLACFGVPVIGLVYEHGRFGPSDTSAAAAALTGYAVGLAGYAGIKVVAPAFYALDDARTPMLVSASSIAVNLGLNWLLVRGFGLGHVGLALSTSAVALGNFAMLFALLRRRVGPLGGALGVRVLQITGAALVMGAVGLAIVAARSVPAPSPWHYACDLALGVPLCVAVYWVVGRALGVPMSPRRASHG